MPGRAAPDHRSPERCGKTTLFNLFTGDLKPDQGTIELFGENVHAHAAGSARRSAAWRALTRSSRCSARKRSEHNIVLSLLGLSLCAGRFPAAIAYPELYEEAPPAARAGWA